MDTGQSGREMGGSEGYGRPRRDMSAANKVDGCPGREMGSMETVVQEGRWAAKNGYGRPRREMGG